MKVITKNKWFLALLGILLIGNIALLLSFFVFGEKQESAQKKSPDQSKGYLARELKLDGGAFDKCLDSGEKAGLVRLHSTEAQSLGLQGTPSFFVNGRAVSGGLSYESLRAVIEEELRTSAGAQQTATR